MTELFNVRVPMFPGFYNTLYSPEPLLTDTLARANGGVGMQDDYEMDNEGYERVVGEAYCRELGPFVCEILNEASEGAGNGTIVEKGDLVFEFRIVDSPKDYSTGNDFLMATVRYTPAFAKAMSWFCMRAQEDLKLYLKEQFAGRSGFLPYYPAELKPWLEVTENFSSFTGPTLESLEAAEEDRHFLDMSRGFFSNLRRYREQGPWVLIYTACGFVLKGYDEWTEDYEFYRRVMENPACDTDPEMFLTSVDGIPVT